MAIDEKKFMDHMRQKIIKHMKPHGVQKKLADLVGKKPSAFSDLKRDKPKPVNVFHIKAIGEYFGPGAVLEILELPADNYGDTAAIKTDQSHEKIKTDALIEMTSKVLGSDTGYAGVLEASIRAFHQAIVTQNRLDNMESELSEMKKTIAALMRRDRRQGDRRQKHIEPEIERRSGLERRTGT